MVPLDLIPLRIPKDSSAEACICALSEGKCYKYFKYTTESLYDYTIPGTQDDADADADTAGHAPRLRDRVGPYLINQHQPSAIYPSALEESYCGDIEPATSSRARQLIHARLPPPHFDSI